MTSESVFGCDSLGTDVDRESEALFVSRDLFLATDLCALRRCLCARNIGILRPFSPPVTVPSLCPDGVPQNGWKPIGRSQLA